MAKKPRLYTSVTPELKAEVAAKSEELKVSGSVFLEMCLRDGLGHFNAYQEYEQLKTQLGEKADECQRLSQERDNMQGNRDKQSDMRQQLAAEYTERIKQIATALGVPNTVLHIRERIDDLHTAAERAKQEYDNMQGERDHADDSRNKFKEKYGQAQAAYEKSDAQVKAYQQRGIWGRVFGLKPKQ